MKKNNLIIKVIKRNIVFSAFAALLIFGSSGDLTWTMGWIFIISYSLLMLIVSAFFTRNPELVKERRTAIRKAKLWDKIILPFITVVFPFLILVISGLDHRYRWTESFITSLQVFFLVISVLSFLFTYWAMHINNFFSSVVRIQTDRDHHVVDSGPYKFIRHPGYLGAIIFNLSMPLILGSLWALIPAVIEVIFFVIRTKLEDNILQKELTGYKEYAGRVRYKLLPLVW